MLLKFQRFAEVLESNEEIQISEETADEIIASSEEGVVEETVTEEVVEENNSDETENASA